MWYIVFWGHGQPAAGVCAGHAGRCLRAAVRLGMRLRMRKPAPTQEGAGTTCLQPDQTENGAGFDDKAGIWMLLAQLAAMFKQGCLGEHLAMA